MYRRGSWGLQGVGQTRSGTRRGQATAGPHRHEGGSDTWAHFTAIHYAERLCFSIFR